MHTVGKSDICMRGGHSFHRKTSRTEEVRLPDTACFARVSALDTWFWMARIVGIVGFGGTRAVVRSEGGESSQDGRTDG